MNEITVAAKDLTRRFGNFTAVDKVSIEVKRGEVFGFLGANGAGKTTMIRMLCGLLSPTEGKATVAGYDIRTQSEQVKRNIGYMSQKFSLYGDLTVQENMRFYGGIYDVKPSILKERMDSWMERLGLASYRRKSTREIPVGIKQRLALGCSLLHDPPIIFLDEPTSGVDPRARRAFWDVIYGLLDEDKTVFVTTHYMDEAEYCSRVSVMQAGKIIAMDSPQKLKDRFGMNHIQDIFIHLLKNETNFRLSERSEVI